MLQSLRETPIPPEVQVTAEGVTCLGIPIGTDRHVRGVLDRKLAELQADFRAVAMLSCQPLHNSVRTATTLTKTCVHTRTTH